MRTARFIPSSQMLLVWLVLILCAAVGRAQVDTGTILGTVTDPSGAVVSGATVTIVNQSSSARLMTKSSSQGRYEFTPLQIGDYRIEVESAGFKKAVVQSVHLNIQQQALVNVMLQTGTVDQTLEVTASPELLQTQSGSGSTPGRCATACTPRR